MILKTFETDQEAQVFLKAILPSNWLIREQKPDYHIDFIIEIVENWSPSGLLFAVQLKGTRHLSIKHGIIKIQFKINQLIYYLDKVRMPVYLIICDVINKKCYWVFLQGYIKNEFKSSSWRRGKKVTIKIPESNLLSDIDIFRDNIKKSEKYIRDLFPSSIPAAISAQQEHWKELDNRIDVDILHSGSNTTYKLKAKEKINYSFLVKGDRIHDFQKKIEEAMNNGSTAEFDSSEIEIKGSELITELLNSSNAQNKFIIKPTPWVRGSVVFQTLTKDENISSIIYNINGKIFIGKKGFTFNGELENAPLKLSISASFESIDSKSTANISMDFNLDNWANKSIITLPYRERLYKLFYDLIHDSKLILQLDTDGNNIFNIPIKIDINRNIKSAFEFFHLMHRTAKIVGYSKVNLILPEKEKITEEDWDTVDVLYNVITNGEYRKSAVNTIFSISLFPSKDLITEIRDEKIFNGTLTLVTDNNSMLFGQNINFGSLQYEIKNVKLISSIDSDLIKELNEESTILLEWEGLENSELIITKAKE